MNVVNSGTTLLAQPVTIKLVFSDDDIYDTADVAVATITKTLKLKPGAAKLLKAKIPTFPEAAGTYRLLAQVDPDNALPEASEANNTAISDQTLVAAAPFADLSVVVINGPQTLTRGRKSAITVELASVGNIPAAGSLAFTVALSPTQTDGANVTVATITKKFKFAADNKRNVKLPFTVPSNIAVGSYAFAVSFQPDPAIGDANSSNNADISDLVAAVS